MCGCNIENIEILSASDCCDVEIERVITFSTTVIDRRFSRYVPFT